jgi:hypothetical protein
MNRELAQLVQEKSRGAKWALYCDHFPPREGETIVDVGVSKVTMPTENYFLQRYPHPHQVVGVGVDELDSLRQTYPAVQFVNADGRELPFERGAFDVAHSNAVVEHVGPLEEQRRFVHEICRVARRGMVTTPSRWFPIESHTRLPLLHYLPRDAYLRALRQEAWGVWLLSARQFLRLFPEDVEVKLVPGRILGMTATLNVIYRWA